MKRSAFAAWFKAQFGAMPNEPKRRRLSTKVQDLEMALHIARKQYEREVWLSDKFDAALKGWNASPLAASGTQEEKK